MKIDAIIALINHPNPSPPDDMLRAAAVEALDMVTTAVDSLKRIADAVEVNDGDAGIPALCSMPENDMLSTFRHVLEKRYGRTIKGLDGTPESVAYDALGRLLDQ